MPLLFGDFCRPYHLKSVPVKFGKRFLPTICRFNPGRPEGSCRFRFYALYVYFERRTEDKEGKTPTLKVDVKSIKAETAGTFRTSRIETAYCRKEAFSEFYRNAFQVVRTAKITEQQRQEMLSLLKGKTENVKELDQRRKHLKRLLLKTGVLEKDVTGALKI